MKHADMPSCDMETGSLVHKQDYDACEEDTKYFLRRVWQVAILSFWVYAAGQ